MTYKEDNNIFLTISFTFSAHISFVNWLTEIGLAADMHMLSRPAEREWSQVFSLSLQQ